MSNTLSVARHDFEYAVRSYLLWAVVGIFGALVLLVAGLPGLISRGSFTAAAVVWFVTILSGILVPLIAIVASYLSIAGERESGTLKLLLSLPPSRRDVVAGKFLGRTGVVLTAILAGTVVAGVVSLLVYGTVPVVAYLLATVLTILLGLSFVGIAVGLSAATSSRQRAMAAGVSAYVLFVAFWDLLIAALDFFLDWGLSIRLSGETVTFLTVFSPGKAYGRLVDTIVLPGLVGRDAANVIAATPVETAGAPVYLQNWFLLVLVVAWTVVPVVIGYWRFDGADIG